MEASAQRIIDRILKDAKQKADSIISEAKKSSEILIENRKQVAIQKSKEDIQSLFKKAQNEAAIISGKVITDKKRKASWLILSEKERLIISVLKKVKSKIRTFQKTENYTLYLEKMIIDSGTALGGGELDIILNKDDSSLPLKIGSYSKEITKRTGVKTQLKISRYKPGIIGVIVKTSDGKIFLDNTFEAIIKRREKELRFKIAKILFSN